MLSHERMNGWLYGRVSWWYEELYKYVQLTYMPKCMYEREGDREKHSLDLKKKKRKANKFF